MSETGQTVMRLLEFLQAPKMDVEPLIEGIRDRWQMFRGMAGRGCRWPQASKKKENLRYVQIDRSQGGPI